MSSLRARNWYFVKKSLKLSSVTTLKIFFILDVNVKTVPLTLTSSLQMLNKLHLNEFIVAKVMNILYNSHLLLDRPVVYPFIFHNDSTLRKILKKCPLNKYDSGSLFP